VRRQNLFCNPINLRLETAVAHQGLNPMAIRVGGERFRIFSTSIHYNSGCAAKGQESGRYLSLKAVHVIIY